MDDTAHAASYADRLDVDRLAELRELDEPGDLMSYVDRAIGNFLGSAEGDLSTMTAAAATGDADRLRAMSHRLAGSALNLGAVSLGEGARQVEELAISGDLTAARAALPVLADLMAGDLAALRAYRREQFPQSD
jgi:HPt (histidine-containing phosphotransfer) domain-containing protein